MIKNFDISRIQNTHLRRLALIPVVIVVFLIMVCACLAVVIYAVITSVIGALSGFCDAVRTLCGDIAECWAE